MMSGFAFLHPLLLWGLPLAAVPILIHLLNRRRFDTRPWAAMEFLMRAMKRNRRRLRMEQWLVLLLRTLAVILLVLLVARPRVGGSLLGRDVAQHVFVIDDSASMAQRGGADSAIDRARAAIERFAETLAAERDGDLLTLLRASDLERPLLALVPVGADLPRRLREALAAVDAGDLGLDLAAVFGAMSDAADAAFAVAPRVEHYLVTDLRRRDWTDADGQPRPSITSWLTGLDAEVAHLTLVDVGSADAENVAVTAARVVDRTCVAGVPVTLAVDVRNQGPGPALPGELTIEVDGGRFVRPLPPLAPGETTTVEFEQTFRSAGWHSLRATLPADRYAVDDARCAAIDVRAALRALVVDGDPGDRPEQAETFYLNAVLHDPTVGVDARLIGPQQLDAIAGEDLADIDLVWLCNVSRPKAEAVAHLERFVASGGGLVIWLGDQIDVAHYTQTLWKDGEGLLPLALAGVDGDLDSPRHVHIVDEDAALFARTREQLNFLFAEVVQVGRWIVMDEAPDLPVDVLLRIDDARGPVLMAARDFADGGRVHVVGTTADAQWSDWVNWPAFPIVVERLTATGSRPQDRSLHHLRPDGRFEIEVDPARHRLDVELRALSGEGDLRTFAATAEAAAATTVTIPMRELQGHGLFAVVRHLHAGGEDRTLIARNPLLDEGLLLPVVASDFVEGLPVELRDRLTIRDGLHSATARAVAGGGISRMLGVLLLVGMLVESLLAWRFGRR